MRNRLLPLAVLAIALGMATSAYAQTNDISVTSLIVDPASGTFDVRTSVWGSAGIGTAPSSFGLYDFTFGVNAANTAAVTGSTNTSPRSAIDQVGFWKPNSPATNPNGIIDPVSGSLQGVISWQNAMVGPVGVLTNIGVADGSSDGFNWKADTKLASGTYNSLGSLDLNLAGKIAFSVLPKVGSTLGQMTTIGPSTWVSGLVTQVITQPIVAGTESGNQGGAGAFSFPTAMTVQAGVVRLGTEFAANSASAAQNLALNIDSSKSLPADPAKNFLGYQEDASVILTADQSIKSLNIVFGQAGLLNGLDLNGKMLSIYGGSTASSDGMPQDLLDAEMSLRTAMDSANATPGDGLYDATAIGSAVKGIGTWIGDDGTGTWVLKVKAVAFGDTDLNGNVGGADLSTLLGNWNPAGGGSGQWWTGDFDRNGNVGGADLSTLLGNWNPSGAPVGLGASPMPEPCTLGLLSLGIVGLLRRRRQA